MVWTVFNAWQYQNVAWEVMAAAIEPPRALRRRQAQRLADLLDHARAHSPLWRSRLPAPRGASWAAAAGDDPAALLQQLPVLQRQAWMASFDQGVCDPMVTLTGVRRFLADTSRVGEPFLGRYTVWSSSGSSGQPGIFVQDPLAMAIYDTLEARRRHDPDAWRRSCDPLLATERWAFVGATGGHFASLVTMSRLLQAQPWRAHALRCLTILQPAALLVQQLNDFEPTIVATYPSAAAMLADEAAAGRLRARPRELWCGGETLSPAVRSHLQQQLGCAVRNSYGASEFLPLGWECRCGQLHLNADWALLEPVDAQGRPVPPGQPAHTTLLTNLANRVQPLIRYDLGDRVTLAERPCRCGSPLPVITVQGRCDDSLVMAGANGQAVTLLPLALSTVLEDEAGLYDFQLQQCDAHTLLLRLAQPESAADARARLARGVSVLRAFATSQGVAQPQIRAESCPELPRCASGKAQRIVAALA